MACIDDSRSLILEYEEKNSEREIGSYVIREKPINDFLFRTIVRINNGFYLVNSSFNQFNPGVLEPDSVYQNIEEAKDKALYFARRKLTELSDKYGLPVNDRTEEGSGLEKTANELVFV